MRYSVKKLICVLTAAFMAFTLCAAPVSAKKSSGTDKARLDRTSVELPSGYSVTIKASGTDGDIKWSSENEDIAEIDSSDGGSVKIIGRKTGKTYIYAKTGEAELKCRVNVKKSFISADKDSLKLEKGKTGKVTFTVKGSKKIAVSRSDKSVCSVSWSKWDGDRITLTVKALKSGSTDIKVYAKGYSGSTAKTIRAEVVGEDTDTDGDIAADVTELVNAEREKAGLKGLKNDPKLNSIADMRAKELTKLFSHTRPDGTDCFDALEDNGIKNVYSGENIAGGYPSVKAAVEGWMKSEGHKANILGENYTRIGVGFYKDDSDLGYYWVQIFTSDY